MKKVILVTIMALAFFATSSAQGRTVMFLGGIRTIEATPDGQTVIKRWSTENSCQYRVSQDEVFVHFVENDVHGNKANSWLYRIVDKTVDYETVSYLLDDGGEGIIIVFWKDNSMVALQTPYSVYLVTEN